MVVQGAAHWGSLGYRLARARCASWSCGDAFIKAEQKIVRWMLGFLLAGMVALLIKAFA
jgi:hypothetical protein